jgi:hypothetical protein
VVEGVGSCSGLAVVEVGWGDPFGIGVGAFSGYRDWFNGRSGNTLVEAQLAVMTTDVGDGVAW